MVIIFRWGGFGLEPTYNIDYEQSLFFSQSDKHLAIKKMARKVATCTLSHIFFATRSANKGKREAACCQSVSNIQ